MLRVTGAIMVTIGLLVGVATKVGAATVCSATEEKKTYVCIENRHGEVLPGQQEWWWYVDPQKGTFSPVVGAEDLGYTKQYACKLADKYDPTISVAYQFPAPNWVITSTKVSCDTRLSAGIPGSGDGRGEGFGDPIDSQGDIQNILNSGIGGELCGGEVYVESVTHVLSDATIVCSHGPSGSDGY